MPERFQCLTEEGPETTEREVAYGHVVQQKLPNAINEWQEKKWGQNSHPHIPWASEIQGEKGAHPYYEEDDDNVEEEDLKVLQC